MTDTTAIHEFFQAACIEYTVVPRGLAPAAKVVVYFVDGEPVQAVLPAILAVNFDWLLDLTRGQALRLADESEVRQLFPDCEPGALPPFAQTHDRPVFVDVALASSPEIVFAAGTAGVICVRWADFAATIRPVVGRFAEPPRDRVGEFRLSYRE